MPKGVKQIVLAVALLVALGGASAVASGKRCASVLGGPADHFERLLLASGYASARMHEESLEVLAALVGEDLKPRTRDSARELQGYNYYAIGDLARAHAHLLEVASSQRQPPCGMPWLWKTLAAVAFEMGRHQEAASYAKAWQVSNEATWRDFAGFRALSLAERLLVAKYLSHVDRDGALAEVYAALADTRAAGAMDAPRNIETATEGWIARLRQGEAPAEIPPLKRPWLEQPAPSLSAAEVMRRLEVLQERRWRLTRPPEQPGGVPREEWVADTWRVVPGAIPPPPPAVVPLALHPPSLPALAVPTVAEASAPDTDRAAECLASRGAEPSASPCPAAD